MTEAIKNYIQLIEYQQQLETFKKEHKELSNMDIIFQTIDFSMLEEYLIKLGWVKKETNEFYSIWEETLSKEMVSFLINREITNWGDNMEKNLKVISKIHNIEFKDVIKNIFR